MCSRKRLTFIQDFINNESVCHFMVVQLISDCSETMDFNIYIQKLKNMLGTYHLMI